MTQDRNYLRMMHDVELTRYAQYHVVTELEFVLLERLERLTDAQEELEDAQFIIEDLQNEIADLQAQL
jgi:hypothetical protein